MAFYWTDKKVLEFAKTISQGSYGAYDGCKTLESKLNAFKGKTPKVKKATRDANGVVTYIDNLGRAWIIHKESLPKKRGEYTFYIADCLSINIGVKSETYRGVKGKVEALAKNNYQR